MKWHFMLVPLTVRRQGSRRVRTRMMMALRAPLLLILVIGASTLPGTRTRCMAFRVKPSPLSSSCPSTRSSLHRLNVAQLKSAPPTRRQIESEGERQQAQEVLGTAELRLPPDDGTFSLLQIIRELWHGPGASKYREGRYATMMRTSSGVWRTLLLGLFPHVVVSAPSKTNWLTQQESAGKVIMGVPQSMERLIGAKSLAGLEKKSRKEFDAVKRILNESLSPEAVLAMQPLVDGMVNRYVSKWRRMAEEQEEVAFLRELAALTLEIVSDALLGDAAASAMDDLFNLVPTFTSCLVSLPLRLPWPLSRIRLLSYGRGLATRKKLLKVLHRAIEKRRAAITSCESSPSGKDLPCVLDRFLFEQLKQREDGKADGRHGVVIDDELICDNMISLLWAGHDTTAISLARVLQYLGSSEGVGPRKALEEELGGTSSRHLSMGTKRSISAGPGKGLFSDFPVLSSIVLESSRLTPIVPCALRVALKDLEVDGYTIPAGQRLAWAPMTTMRSEDLYEAPDSFCPFRFLHGRNNSPLISDRDAQDGGDDDVTDPSTQDKLIGAEQDRADGAAPDSPPPLFGFGKHMCPGRELAKLEHISVLRRFLSEFDYHLLEGQSFRETMPLNAPRDGLRLLLSLKETTATGERQVKVPPSLRRRGR